DRPCPGSTHMYDAIDGSAPHAEQRLPIYIVAKSPLARLVEWARERGWRRLPLLSTAGNGYDADYFGDTSKLPRAVRLQNRHTEGRDWDESTLNVFRKESGGT